MQACQRDQGDGGEEVGDAVRANGHKEQLRSERGLESFGKGADKGCGGEEAAGGGAPLRAAGAVTVQPGGEAGAHEKHGGGVAPPRLARE